MPPPTAQTRARDLGLRFPGETGPANAITDIPGVEVGQTTLIHGDGALHVGAGPVRTGVTIVLPRGRSGVLQPVKAGVYALNGNGEMTGTHWIEEAGIFRGPIGLTNTHSIGMVHHALVRWLCRVDGDRGAYPWLMPVVAETCDAVLNDMDGLHIEESHVLEAIAAAAPVPSPKAASAAAPAWSAMASRAERARHRASWAWRARTTAWACWSRPTWASAPG